MNSIPDRIYIEKHLIDHPFTEKILERLPDLPVTYIDDYKSIGLNKSLSERASRDKDSLAIAEKKGEVIKSIGRMEENQYYLFHEIDCKYDCEYCYLQYYFQTKVPVIFANREKVLSEIEQVLRTREDAYFHVGEVCDSLAFDYLTDFSVEIAELFRKYENATVEFRTKSTNIENLLNIKNPPKNLIPSWTMSPEYIADKIEHKTPGFRDRLDAAKRCQQKGYTVGIRLDPIFSFEGWEDHYRDMVSEILTVLNPEKIDHITLGTVKVHKNLFDVLNTRFPESMVTTDELVPSSDGKFKPIKFKRVEIYRKMVSWVRNLAPEIGINLSIESPEVGDLVFS